MAHSQEKVASVYDFMYVDTKRIELLLSQFGTDGVMTELTRATDATSETGGGFDLKIASMNQKEGEKSGLTRRFDPRWLTPLTFLREAQGMIVRDISAARIGQFVLAGGTLSISDLNVLKQLWDVPIVQAAMAQQPMSANDVQLSQMMSRQQRRASERTNKGPQESPQLAHVKAILDFVKVLPHGVLATFDNDDGHTIWCALRGDSLLMPSSDLMLNHGAVISGKWRVVGILDALSASGDSPSPKTTANALTNLMNILGPITRNMLGRPDGAYGITPLLIFREIE
jgi:hypothetical protein